VGNLATIFEVQLAFGARSTVQLRHDFVTMDFKNDTELAENPYPWDMSISEGSEDDNSDSDDEEPWMETQEAHDQTGNVQDTIQLFLVDDDEPVERYGSSLQNLRDFCGGRSVAQLRQENPGNMSKNTFIQDRDRKHRVIDKFDLQPVSAHTLYNHMKRNVRS
jgi:hypothetical protein